MISVSSSSVRRVTAVSERGVAELWCVLVCEVLGFSLVFLVPLLMKRVARLCLESLLVVVSGSGGKKEIPFEEYSGATCMTEEWCSQQPGGTILALSFFLQE